MEEKSFHLIGMRGREGEAKNNGSKIEKNRQTRKKIRLKIRMCQKEIVREMKGIMRKTEKREMERKRKTEKREMER